MMWFCTGYSGLLPVEGLKISVMLLMILAGPTKQVLVVSLN